MDHFKRVATARSDLTEAELRAATAQSARIAAAHEYRSLAEFDLVEPLRPLSVDLDNARRTVAAAEPRLSELLVARNEGRTLDQAATVKLSEAIISDQAAEDILRHFGPLWSEAEKLDAELVAARIELDEATEKSQNAETILHTQAEELSALDHIFDEKTKSLDQAATKLKDQSSRALLADRLVDATALLQKRVMLKRDCATVKVSAAPRLNLLCHPYAREGQAVVCPLLRGSSPTRCVAPKPLRARHGSGRL